LSLPSTLALWIAWLLAASAGLGALVLGALFVQAARLPYNPQGRYFADGVVQSAQAVPVYGWLAAIFLGLAIAFAWLAVRIGRRRSPD